MKKNIFRSVLILFVVSITIQVFAQKKTNQHAFEIKPALIKAIENSPEEEVKNLEEGIPMILKNPNGQDETYYCFENNTMSEEMKAKHPEIKTYTGYNKNNMSQLAMITVNSGKLHAFVDAERPFQIDPEENTSKYVSKDYVKEDNHVCGIKDEHYELHNRNVRSGNRQFMAPSNGSNLRTLDFAIVSTTEFNTQYGANANANIIGVVNDLNSIYRRTLAVTFSATIRKEGVDGTFDVVVSGGSDPNMASRSVLNYFTTSSYDIGQVIHHQSGGGGSGVAYLGVICVDNIINQGGQAYGPFKAGGWTQGSSMGIIFGIGVHEIGHMFDADHSFNGTDGNCSPAAGQLNPSSSIEPGSGSTIMSYGGSCNTHNLTSQNGSPVGDDLYFHQFSVEQMLTFINTTSCLASTPSGNTPPVATANPCSAVYDLPKSTPFVLTGNATDANGDALTYQWDQVNIGPPHGAPNIACGSTTGPIFRSYPPRSSKARTFPALEFILNNANSPLGTVGECLPSVARTLNFKLLVYDNNIAAGGIDNSAITVNVKNDGPLVVTYPNASTSLVQGSAITVTWDVNNTSNQCNTMNILLSVDGGQTFAYTLKSSTLNDGSELVNLPSQILGTTNCRIKVESNCYTCFKFFDIGNANFTLTSPCAASITNINPITPLTAASGNSALNLSQTNNLGSVITSISGSLTTSDPAGNLIFTSNGVCSGPSNPTYYKVFPIVVSTTGNYTINHGGPFGVLLNIYQNSFTGTNCSTNRIAGSATLTSPDAFVSINSGFTTALTANVPYFLVVSGFSTSTPTFPTTYNITFSSIPTGASVYNGPILPSGYSYTYVARNTANNLIQSVKNNATFSTTLSGGNYEIYGVAYYSASTTASLTSVDPNSWVNQDFNTIKNTGGCLYFSDNFRPVTVTGCSNTVSSQAQTGGGSLQSALSCGSNGIITFSPGVDTIFSTSAITMTGNFTIEGNNQLSIQQNFNSAFGIKIPVGSNVTLKNMKIQATNQGAANNVILNEGNLTLENVEIIGNTAINQVVRNASGATLKIKGASRIRKI
jgi:hypothetical protein